MKLSFDGHGINGGDEFMSRVATLTEHGQALKIGNMLASAAELYSELSKTMALLRSIHDNHPTEWNKIFSPELREQWDANKAVLAKSQLDGVS